MTANGSTLETLDGPVAHTTLRLLRSAAHGNDDLLRDLVEAGLALGELVRDHGLWQWGGTACSAGGRLAALIEARATELTGSQLDALEALTHGLSKPYSAVAKARRGTDLRIRLTPREQEILILLSGELTTCGIARRLGLSPRTVTKHQENLYRKFGTSTRLATVLLAQRFGMVTISA
jgi:DNA-binding CsgD family transcriptional regulator